MKFLGSGLGSGSGWRSGSLAGGMKCGCRNNLRQLSSVQPASQLPRSLTTAEDEEDGDKETVKGLLRTMFLKLSHRCGPSSSKKTLSISDDGPLLFCRCEKFVNMESFQNSVTLVILLAGILVSRGTHLFLHRKPFRCHC